MSAASRVKGRRAEAEVAAILRAHGFTVRGLEGGGDHMAVGHGLTLHIEVKRQERGFRAAWARQAQREAPFNAMPTVVYRRNRSYWMAATPEAYAVGFYLRSGVDYSMHAADGQWWAHLSLTRLLEAMAR